MKECGERTACCIGVVGFKEGDVEVNNNRVCSKLINKKCSIYDNRPYTCRSYFCVWKYEEELPDFMRPDLSGMIITNATRLDFSICSIRFLDEKNINLQLFSKIITFFHNKNKNVSWVINDKIYWLADKETNDILSH